MNARLLLGAVALCAATWGAGCNRSASSDAGGDAAPQTVVTTFLEAIRTGDDERVASLLTPLARQKTAEMEMVVAPPGSDTARFQVIESKSVDQNYHVTADWTDLDSDGQPHTDRIVWILRRVNDEGWRISGMATQVFADCQPIILNFEDPGEMLRRQQQAEEEIARRDRQQETQAKNPPDEPAGAVR